MGAIAREMLLFCRRYKLLFRFVNQNHSLKIIARNNNIFFRTEQKMPDLKIPYIFYTILANAGTKKWAITSRLSIDKKQIELALSSEDFEFILPLETEKNYATFDSRGEGVIFRTLQQVLPKKWKLMREFSSIALDKTIMVPDFSIVNEEIKIVFMEIIGFWREEYIEKKLKKLSKIASTHIPMILLIDEKIFKNFSGVAIPKLKYKTGTDSIFLDYKE